MGKALEQAENRQNNTHLDGGILVKIYGQASILKHKKEDEQMVVRIEATPTEITARLLGELDHHTARVMREQVDAAVGQSTAKLLRLDFSGVGFMDSSGIGLIMGRYRLMQTRGGRLLVIGVSDRLLRVMKLAGLERLPIWADVPTGTNKKEAYKR